MAKHPSLMNGGRGSAAVPKWAQRDQNIADKHVLPTVQDVKRRRRIAALRTALTHLTREMADASTQAAIVALLIGRRWRLTTTGHVFTVRAMTASGKFAVASTTLTYVSPGPVIDAYRAG